MLNNHNINQQHLKKIELLAINKMIRLYVVPQYVWYVKQLKFIQK